MCRFDDDLVYGAIFIVVGTLAMFWKFRYNMLHVHVNETKVGRFVN